MLPLTLQGPRVRSGRFHAVAPDTARHSSHRLNLQAAAAGRRRQKSKLTPLSQRRIFSQSTHCSRHLKECAAAGREDHRQGRRPARWTTLNFFLRRYGHASPSPLSLLRTRGMQSSSSSGTEGDLVAAGRREGEEERGGGMEKRRGWKRLKAMKRTREQGTRQREQGNVHLVITDNNLHSGVAGLPQKVTL